MALQEPFSTASQVTRNYGAEEFLSGVFTVKHYVFQTGDLGIAGYALSSHQIQTQEPTRTLDTDGGTQSFNFDSTTVAEATTVQGTGYVATRFSYALGTAGRTSRLKIYLIKYDGSTETVIATAQSGDFTATTAADEYTFKLDCTTTTLSRDDLLRVKIENDTDTGVGGPDSSFSIGTDPEGTDNLTEIYIPFRRNT